MLLILVSLCGLISYVSQHKHLLVHLSCHSITKTKQGPFKGVFASVFPKGWDPATGYCMHPDFFSTPPKMQFSASASQPIASQPDPSAVQPMDA